MTKKIQFVLASLLLVAFAGCSSGSQQQAQQPAPPAQQAPPPEAQAPPAAAPSQAAQPVPARPRPVRKQAPAYASNSTPTANTQPAVSAPEPVRAAAPAPVALPPRPVSAYAAAGTPIEIRLTQALNSATDKTGDKFEGTLAQDLVVDGKLLAPRGSVAVGKLSEVEGSGRVQGRAKMSLTLTELRVGQDEYPIRTNVLSFEAEGSKGRDAKVVGGTTGLGAVIGAIAGGKKGAAIGAVVGAGAGAGTVMATKGKELEFEPEHRFSFKLENDVEMKIRR